MKNNNYKPKKYSLGLDIGTTSVGWAVLDIEKERIHDLGVRIFERPENPQNGDSLAKPRRDARSARRRLKRRRQRLNEVKRFFIENKLLDKDKIDGILDPKSKYNEIDVYDLRDKALEEELSPEELFKVIYQIAKRRGFKSNRKVAEESDSEGGRVIKSINANQKFLVENNYNSVGEALAEDKKFESHKRNKRDSYVNSFSRKDFLDELLEIIDNQKQYSLKNIDEESINEFIYGINDGDLVNVNAIFYQRPFMTKELIEKMVGECTFEKGEKRAPRGSYSFELFRLVSNLSSLRYIPESKKNQRESGKDIISLSPEQIKNVIEVAKKGGKLTYKKVREAAGIPEDYKPDYVRGKISPDDPNGEKNDFGGFKAYHDIRLALKNILKFGKKLTIKIS